MDYQITIKFSTDNEYILENIGMLLDNSLPFMVDNVKITSDFSK